MVIVAAQTEVRSRERHGRSKAEGARQKDRSSPRLETGSYGTVPGIIIMQKKGSLEPFSNERGQASLAEQSNWNASPFVDSSGPAWARESALGEMVRGEFDWRGLRGDEHQSCSALRAVAERGLELGQDGLGSPPYRNFSTVGFSCDIPPLSRSE